MHIKHFGIKLYNYKIISEPLKIGIGHNPVTKKKKNLVYITKPKSTRQKPRHIQTSCTTSIESK